MERVEITNVQQINDRAYYRQGNRWVDGKLISSGKSAESPRVVTPGSAEYRVIYDQLIKDGNNGALSLEGDKLISVDGEAVLVK